MKKTLIGITLGTLGVLAITTPLILTSCSKLKKITINIDDVIYDNSESAFTYNHKFFDFDRDGTLTINDDLHTVLDWTYLGNDYSEIVFLGKNKEAIDSYIDLLPYLHYEYTDIFATESKKLKKGENVVISYNEHIVKLRCMVLNNFDEIYSKLYSGNN